MRRITLLAARHRILCARRSRAARMILSGPGAVLYLSGCPARRHARLSPWFAAAHIRPAGGTPVHERPG